MQVHERVLLNIIGRELFSDSFTMDAHIDMAALYEETYHQSVVLLAWQAFTNKERVAISPEIKTQWRENAFQQIAKNHALLEEQKSILNLLDKNGITCAVLKGSSVACNYPDPLLRTFGDIDILVSPDDQKQAVEILQSVGYGDALEDSHHCHYTVSKGKVVVEVHREPNGIHIVADSEIAEKLHLYFENALKDIRKIDGIPVLNKEYQSVVLLMHKLEHFLYGGFGLRQLCDWACFVNRQLSIEDFESLRPILEKFGLMEFAGIITRVCCDWLHLPMESAPWCMCYDADLAKEVMEEIISSGNFGRKNSMYGQRVFENYASSNRISSAFKVLWSSCRYHWPPCDKYPVLMPIGVVVNVSRYIKLRIQGKRPDIHPVKLFQASGPKQKLYKSLKPFQK